MTDLLALCRDDHEHWQGKPFSWEGLGRRWNGATNGWVLLLVESDEAIYPPITQNIAGAIRGTGPAQYCVKRTDLDAWLREAGPSNVVCPACDGTGLVTVEDDDERWSEECFECDGERRIVRIDEGLFCGSGFDRGLLAHALSSAPPADVLTVHPALTSDTPSLVRPLLLRGPGFHLYIMPIWSARQDAPAFPWGSLEPIPDCEANP